MEGRMDGWMHGWMNDLRVYAPAPQTLHSPLTT